MPTDRKTYELIVALTWTRNAVKSLRRCKVGELEPLRQEAIKACRKLRDQLRDELKLEKKPERVEEASIAVSVEDSDISLDEADSGILLDGDDIIDRLTDDERKLLPMLEGVAINSLTYQQCLAIIPLGLALLRLIDEDAKNTPPID